MYKLWAVIWQPPLVKIICYALYIPYIWCTGHPKCKHPKSLFYVLPSVRHTAHRRIRGPSYPTLEGQTSRIVKATPPSGTDVGTKGHQLSAGKLRPLTKNLRIGNYHVMPYRSWLSVRPVAVHRIYESVRNTKHQRRNYYSDKALLAIHTVVAHYDTKERVLAPAM